MFLILFYDIELMIYMFSMLFGLFCEFKYQNTKGDKTDI